jgi:hypothetical protein
MTRPKIVKSGFQRYSKYNFMTTPYILHELWCMQIPHDNKKSLKIPKGQSEFVIKSKEATHNAIAKRKGQKDKQLSTKHYIET